MTAAGVRGSDGCCGAAPEKRATSAGATRARRNGERMRQTCGSALMSARKTCRPLLPTAALRIWLRLVDHQSLRAVRNRLGDVVHEPRDSRHVVVVDVLRLVHHLVVA